MSDSAHDRLSELFLAACELPPAERSDFLRRACDGDGSLRRDVESLLAHHRDDDAILPSPSPAARFRPGQLFAGRYRILTRLGRGGMGEVYRAHDELLDQAVAVKILRGRDASAIEALLREVRLARSVTHPAVCRVFDVAEADDEPFFTMELVEGEDLASLLRRAGRLAPGKVLDLARQLLAGLAAAHARGVVHRDLKPANVLIDSDGRARLTDFGIAVSGADGAQPALGTPGYMAPEQWAGQTADERSDLYSLALLLHEALTGRPAFDADRMDDLARAHRTQRPVPPSREVPGVDPAFEAVLLQALEKDPALRPASALAMAAALPGGDALAMALGAGVTPPVDVVAASGSAPGLSWRKASGLGLLLAAMLAAMLPLSEAVHPLHAAGEIEAPAVLRHRAEVLLRELGYDTASVEPDFGFSSDPTAAAAEDSLFFWLLYPHDRWVPPWSGRVLAEPTEGGGILTVLDPRGHLVYLRVDPAASAALPGESAGPEELGGGVFDRLLTAAGIAGLEREAITSSLPVFADERGSWTVQLPGDEHRTRVDAAAVARRPVLFSTAPVAGEEKPKGPEDGEVRAAVALVLLVFVLLPALPLAWRNLRQGRGDVRGARRLVEFIAVTLAVAWLAGLGYRQGPFETQALAFRNGVVQVALQALWVWVAYLGLEPLARRWWPESLVAWNRLLAGSWRDPVVARSLLAGSLVGTASALLSGLGVLAGRHLGPSPPLALSADVLNASLGIRSSVSVAVSMVPLAIYNAFFTLLLLVLLQSLLRDRRRSVPLFVGVLTMIVGLLGGGTWVTWVYALIFALAAAVVLTRYGLAAFCCAFYVQNLLSSFPLSRDLDAWFADSGLLALGVVASIGVVGCRIGMESRSGVRVESRGETP